MENLFESDLSIEGLTGVMEIMTDDELLGAIRRNPKAFKRFVKRVRTAPSAGKQTSREELQKRMNQLHPEIQKRLATGKDQSVDTYLSFARSISGSKSVEMLKDSDNKEVGVCMLNGGKLEKGEPFMLTGIILMEGIGSGTTEDAATISPVNFGQLSSAVRNGQFEFIANGKTLIPDMSNEVFVHSFEKNVVEDDVAPDYAYGYAISGKGRFGMYRLDNPKMIETQVAMELNVKWGVAAATNSFLKAVLVGSRVYKH
jgi:hypothetical protein